MKFNGSIEPRGPGRIDQILSWIRMIVRTQEPDLAYTGLLHFSGISEEVMDGFWWNPAHGWIDYILSWIRIIVRILCRWYMHSTECPSSLYTVCRRWDEMWLCYVVADRCYSVIVDFVKVHDLDYTSVMVCTFTVDIRVLSLGTNCTNHTCLFTASEVTTSAS